MNGNPNKMRQDERLFIENFTSKRNISFLELKPYGIWTHKWAQTQTTKKFIKPEKFNKTKTISLDGPTDYAATYPNELRKDGDEEPGVRCVEENCGFGSCCKK